MILSVKRQNIVNKTLIPIAEIIKHSFVIIRFLLILPMNFPIIFKPARWLERSVCLSACVPVGRQAGWQAGLSVGRLAGLRVYVHTHYTHDNHHASRPGSSTQLCQAASPLCINLGRRDAIFNCVSSTRNRRQRKVT